MPPRSLQRMFEDTKGSFNKLHTAYQWTGNTIRQLWIAHSLIELHSFWFLYWYCRMSSSYNSKSMYIFIILKNCSGTHTYDLNICETRIVMYHHWTRNFRWTRVCGSEQSSLRNQRNLWTIWYKKKNLVCSTEPWNVLVLHRKSSVFPQDFILS